MAWTQVLVLTYVSCPPSFPPSLDQPLTPSSHPPCLPPSLGMTAHLVIGGCVGEAAVPVLVGAAMHSSGPSSLPPSILAMVGVLVLMVIGMEVIVWRKEGREGGEAQQQQQQQQQQQEQKDGEVMEGGKEGGREDEVSEAGTEAGHLSLASWMTPGNPYLLPIGV